MGMRGVEMRKESALRLLKGKEAIILRNVTFATIYKRYEEIFGESPAALIMFEAGKGCGKRSIERLASTTKATGKRLLVKVERLKRAEGWCLIDFGRFDLKAGKGVIIVKDSFEALGYGSSQRPMCQFLRGFLSSAVSYVLKRDVVLTETKCLAKGDPYCEFIL